ncbi:MAG: BspA family leucine-rich repeat surface protein [Bacilli bacterium]|nr:BspA family leucine-rich repeat surface protein [Bacilli bacterium]
MKRINNKGFAISTIIYGTLIMAVMIVMILLSTMSFSNKSTKDLVKEIEEDLNSTAIFDTGENVNQKMKKLANPGASDVTKDFADTKIKAIKGATTLPSGFTPAADNNVSITPKKPIYIWFDSTDETIYFHSDAVTLYLNANSNYMFMELQSLTDISFLSSVDTSGVTRMQNMFKSCKSVTNIDALTSWNTINVTNMRGMFYGCKDLTNINGASNWNTSNAADMSAIFQECSSLTNINGASNWDTSSATSMYAIFYYCSALTNINALSNWDTSKVTDMRRMFQRCTLLESINGASNWDTSKVTEIDYMFYYCPKASGTIKILSNPTTYTDAFANAATDSGAQITVNYRNNTTNIDNIIATKSENSNVQKGTLIS